jgi:hypothetical protein
MDLCLRPFAEERSQRGREILSMSHELKPGDRVRLTTRGWAADYVPGDKGTVTDGPKHHTGPGPNDPYYLVVMDKDEAHRKTVFNADDLEPDRA